MSENFRVGYLLFFPSMFQIVGDRSKIILGGPGPAQGLHCHFWAASGLVGTGSSSGTVLADLADVYKQACTVLYDLIIHICICIYIYTRV